MAEVTHLGQSIAERKLEVRQGNGKTETVVVQIGLPVKMEPDGDFCCPYSISSRARTKLRGVLGIDSVQSLALTLATIRNELEAFEEKEKGALH